MFKLVSSEKQSKPKKVITNQCFSRENSKSGPMYRRWRPTRHIKSHVSVYVYFTKYVICVTLISIIIMIVLDARLYRWHRQSSLKGSLLLWFFVYVISYWFFLFLLILYNVTVARARVTASNQIGQGSEREESSWSTTGVTATRGTVKRFHQLHCAIDGAPWIGPCEHYFGKKCLVIKWQEK